MERWIIQAAGVSLVVVALLDVFLTVLVARNGTSIVSERLFALTWRVSRVATARLSQPWRDRLLIYVGPLNLVLIFATWAWLLLVGFALVYWPLLGTSLRVQLAGETPTDFLSALYVSSDCVTTVGNGDFAPTTGGTRMIIVVNCLLGISTITLTITYFVQIFGAMQRRNALAASLHLATHETGRADEWLAGLGAAGSFDGAANEVGQITQQMAEVHEAYHLYPSLLYFRFASRAYSQARVAGILMDAAALAHATLDAEANARFLRSASIRQLGFGGLRMLQELTGTYLPHAVHEVDVPDAARREQWRRHYARARQRLSDEDIHLTPDADGSFDRYVEHRARWDHYVRALARYLGEPLDQLIPDALAPEPGPLQ